MHELPGDSAADPDRSQRTIQSVDRAARILTAFTQPQQQLTITEIAAYIGVHKSTASHLVSTLTHAGLLEGGGEGRSITLGPELWRLARLAFAGVDLAEIARMPMDQLTAETGETVTLSVREGDYAVTVAQSGGTHRVGVQSWLGARTPLAHTADGKVLLAFGGAERRGLTATLRAELTATRKRGWASARGELEEHLHGVAVPLNDADGNLLAALCVSGPSYRLPEDRFEAVAAQCRHCADQISERHANYMEHTA